MATLLMVRWFSIENNMAFIFLIDYWKMASLGYGRVLASSFGSKRS